MSDSAVEKWNVGIGRVQRGYVIIVSDTELGDQVVIEITNVRQNMTFADVLEQS